MKKTVQKQIIDQLKVKPTIDPKAEFFQRLEFLRNFLRTSQLKGFVLGISGGQDSTLAGKLAQFVVDKTKYNFIAVNLPYGEQSDAEDVTMAFEYIKPKTAMTINIKPIVDVFCSTYEQATGQPLTDYHKGNVKARVRAVVQYAIAGMHNLAVIGTDHAAEAVVGFFTKFGDGASDINPLNGLTKTQGKELLKAMGCPSRLYTKTPTPNLLDDKPDQPDEAELGLSYEKDIDVFLTGHDVTDEVFFKIFNQFIRTEHKRKPPIVPE